MKLVRQLFCVFLLIANGYGQPQAMDRSELENRLMALDARLDSLDRMRADLVNQAEIITSKLALYGNRESLTVKEHKSLEKLMQDSQQVNQDVRQIDTQIKECNRVVESVLKGLVVRYQTSIDTLLFEIKRENLSSDTRENLGSHLQQIIERQKIVQNRLVSTERPAILQNTIEIYPWDTPEKMKLKGDLLMDQEESLRQEIHVIDERIAALIQEKNLRTRMSELDVEVDLFNEDEEIFGKSNESYGNAAYWNEQIEGGVDFHTTRKSTDGYSVFSETPDENVNQSAPRTPETIQQIIHRLNKYRSMMSSRADSLKQKAEKIYQIADEKLER